MFPSPILALIVLQSPTVTIQQIAPGKGVDAKTGDVVFIEYTGKVGGKEFESTKGHAPLRIKLGAGEIIDGLENGLVGMKAGELRKLTVPPTLGFGSVEVNAVPAGSTLLFEVKLLRVEKKEIKQVVEIKEVTPGHGETAVKDGDTVEVHYTGSFLNGTKFDSSLDRKQTFSFKVGAGQVIKGFDMGVTGMKVGGKRKVTIPSEFGYGSRGAGGVIPPDATLVFDLEMISINKKG